MEIEFSSNKLMKQLTTPLEIKKSYGTMAQKVNQRIQEMKNSPTLAVLQTIPAANCHPLKGDMSGEWAVDISGNFRILFIINQSPIPKNKNNSIDTNSVTKIKITAVKDYH